MQAALERDMISALWPAVALVVSSLSRLASVQPLRCHLPLLEVGDAFLLSSASLWWANAPAAAREPN